MQLSHFSTATTTCPNHRTMLLSSLSTAHFPLCSKLATIFKYGLIKDSVPQNVFMLHQHMRFLKRGNEKRLFTNRVIYDHDWWLEVISLLAQLFLLLLQKLRELVMNAVFVL